MVEIKESHFIEKYSLDIFNGTVDIYWGEDSFIYVPVEKICELLELNHDEQFHQMKSHVILSDGLVKTNHLNQEEFYLRTDKLALWLVTLPLNKLNPSIKKELQIFQNCASLILQEAFVEGKLFLMEGVVEKLSKDSVSVKAYKEAIILLNIARQRLVQEVELNLP